MSEVQGWLQFLGGGVLTVLWTGTCIGTFAAVTNFSCRRLDARIRYAICLTGLVLLAASLPLSFAFQPEFPNPRVEAAEFNSVSPAPFQAEPSQANANNQAGETSTPELPGFESSDLITEATSPPAQRTPGRQIDRPTQLVKSSERLPFAVGVFYLCGVAFLLLKLLLATYTSHRIRRCCVPAAAIINSMGSRLSARLNMRFRPAVRCCQRVAIPIVVGTLRPIVVLPASFVTGLSSDEVEAVVLHELCHISRYDHVALIAQRLAEIIAFFHPLTWYLSRQVSVEREHCCDDKVLRHGVERTTYSTALYRIAAQTASQKSVLALAANGNQPSTLRLRVMRILGEPQPADRTLLTLIVTIAVCLGIAKAADPVQEPGPPKRDTAAGLTTKAGNTETDRVETVLDQTISKRIELKERSASGLRSTLAQLGKDAGLEVTLDDKAEEALRPMQPERGDLRMEGISTRSALKILLDQFQSVAELTYAIGHDAIRIRLRDDVQGHVFDAKGNAVAGALVFVSPQWKREDLSIGIRRLFESRWAQRRRAHSNQIVIRTETDSRGQFRFAQPALDPNGHQHLLWVFSPKHGLLVRPLYSLDKAGNRVLRIHGEAATLTFRNTSQSIQLRERLFSDDHGPKQSLAGVKVRPRAVTLIPSLYADEQSLRSRARRDIFLKLRGSKDLLDVSQQQLLDGLTRFPGYGGYENYEVAWIPDEIAERTDSVANEDGLVSLSIDMPILAATIKTKDGIWQHSTIQAGRTLPVLRRANVTGRIDGYREMPKGSLSIQTMGQDVPINPDGTFKFVQPRGTVSPDFEITKGVPFYIRKDGLVISRPHQVNQVQYRAVRAATVRGSLVDPDGHPVSNALLKVRAEPYESEKYVGFRPTEVRTDDRGRFQTLVHPGRLRSLGVVKLPPGYERFFSYDTTGTIRFLNESKLLAAGQTFEPEPLQLVAPRTITGRVVDTNNNPVPNAMVYSYVPVRANRGPQAETNALGEFELAVSNYWLRFESMDIPSGTGGSLKTDLLVSTSNGKFIPATIHGRDPWLAQIPVLPDYQDVDEATRQVLAKGVRARVFKNEPLSEVLRSISRAPFIWNFLRIDKAAFEARGIDPKNIRITHTVPATSLGLALQGLLPKYGLVWAEPDRQPETRSYLLIRPR